MQLRRRNRFLPSRGSAQGRPAARGWAALAVVLAALVGCGTDDGGMARLEPDAGTPVDAERPGDPEVGSPDLVADGVEVGDADPAVDTDPDPDAPATPDASEDADERDGALEAGSDSLPGPGELCGIFGIGCASGVCLDYRCCDSPCTDVCMACTWDRTGMPDGQCAPVLSGTDPDGECADQGPESCGTSGVCNGAGACATYPDGTLCRWQVCERASDPICTYACAGGRCDTTSPLPPACGSDDLKLSDSLRVAPAAEGERFVRCGTLGQEAGGWQLTVSPDGRRLAARTRTGTVRLFATDTWQELAQLASPVGQIDVVAFSPDSARLATLSVEMGATTLWRSEDGSLERSFPGSGMITGSGPSGLSFSPDGQRLATSLGMLIELASGNTSRWTIRVGRPAIRFMGADTLFVEHTHQGGGNSSHGIKLVHLTTGQTTGLAWGATSPINGFALSRDGQWVAYGRSFEMEPGLELRRGSTGELMAADYQHYGRVLAFSPSGDHLYVVGGKGVQVRRRVDLKVVRTFGWQTPNQLLGVSPQGLLVVSTGGETLFYDPHRSYDYPVRRLPVGLDAITWSDNGQLEVGTARDGRYFHVWRTGDLAELCAPAAAAAVAPVTAAASSPDGSWVALGRQDGVVEVASATGAGAVSIATGRGGLIRVAVSNDGRRVATLAASEPRNPSGDDTGCFDYGAAPGLRPLEVFDVPSGSKLRTLTLPEAFCDFALSPDGQLIAHTDGSIRTDSFRHVYLGSHVRVLSVETGLERLRIGPTEPETISRGGTYILHGFSPDNARLAVGTSGGIATHRVIDGSLDRSYPDVVFWRRRAVSPGWFLLASGHGEGPYGGALRVLDMADGSSPATFANVYPQHIALGDSWVGALGVLYHGNGQDWTMFRMWDVPSGQLLRTFGGTVPLPNGPDRLVTYQEANLALWCR
jgi:WD40 repeat protein